MNRSASRTLRTAAVSALLLAALALSAPRLVSGQAATSPQSAADTKDQPSVPSGGYGGAVAIPEPVVPAGTNTFNLTFEETKRYSRISNFEIVGHNYFKGPWLTPTAQTGGLGASFNTPRVYDGILYAAGYNQPAILFGTIIADVKDPTNMTPLSFVPCNPGARCNYIRVNQKRKLLVATQDTSGSNPIKATGPVAAGVTLTDVSDPRSPKDVGFVATAPDGQTHGLDIDDRYVYACAEMPESKKTGSNHELVIIDYADVKSAKIVGRFHVQGQHEGETYGELDQKNPDGTPQQIWCHEIYYDQNRLYVAWRDAGMMIFDVTDRTSPKQLSRYDWVPPYNGGGIGSAHSLVPLIPFPDKLPTIAITTDENFSCPAGFGRVFDISVMSSPQILSTFRIPAAHDHYDFAAGKWICPPGQQTSHMPWFDYRSSSLLYLTWYAQGIRVFDFTNPYEPREIGYYLSPPYPGRGADNPRQTREPFQDSTTGLIYLTDGNGGGITVLRWTGPIPPNHQVPGAR